MLGNARSALVWWGRCRCSLQPSPKQAVTPAITQVVAQIGSCQEFCGALGLGSGKTLGRVCSGTGSWGQQLVKDLLSNRNSHFILLEKEHFLSFFWFLFFSSGEPSLSVSWTALKIGGSWKREQEHVGSSHGARAPSARGLPYRACAISVQSLSPAPPGCHPSWRNPCPEYHSCAAGNSHG